jgi:hypothetical protein
MKLGFTEIRKEYEEDYKRWIEKYQPIMDDDGEPCGFDTYDFDIKYVDAQNNHNIWTLISCDGDKSIISGKCFVNRDVYFITKNKWEKPETIIIKRSWDDEEDEF